MHCCQHNEILKIKSSHPQKAGFEAKRPGSQLSGNGDAPPNCLKSNEKSSDNGSTKKEGSIHEDRLITDSSGVFSQTPSP